MESLIGAILDAVFASLAESVSVSDWLRDRLGRDPEKLAFRAALTQALADTAEHFPGRDLRYFTETLRDFGGPLLARTLQPAATLLTATELTAAWLTHLNLDSPVYYRADFEHFAMLFLTSLQHNLENQQPLQWIAQLRTQKLTADAARRSTDTAEESAALLAALQAQLRQLNERLAQLSQISTGGGAVVKGNVQTGRDFVGRDRVTIRNYFTGGLGRLHIDYSVRIEEFLLEYLGSKRKRVPFGGRTAQLAELDAWLTDHTAPPYYLMTAEAGRGKSALVCRWQTQVLTHGNIEVIFLPISIRFETATQDVVFAALAARLAAIYGDEMQASVLSADQWRATCQSYLRREPPNGKQLLVILDGLDEATGWTPGRGLFPGDPPDGLRVLVTARQRAGEVGPQGWAATLGWDDDQLAKKVTLVGLNRTGVQEALASMGNPLDRLATQVDVVGELFRLTEGDPLLVRLYVDALVGKGKTASYLRAEELTTIQPGLQGYFDRWWDEQHQQWMSEGRDPLVEQEQLRALLNAVATALGPLSLSDLAAVSDLTDGIMVRRLVQTVSRWLIGDGRNKGYTFSHPRLGYYFWELMGETKQSQWDLRFTAWGATTIDALNSGALAPKAAPPYVVQHYAAHLTRSVAPAAQFYTLLSNGWRQAWEEVDVTYGGFLNDIACVEAQARTAYQPTHKSQAEVLIQHVKAIFCHTSVIALGTSVKPELLRLTLIYGLCTTNQVLAMIQLIPEDSQRANALAKVVDRLSSEMMSDALTIARSIDSEEALAYALEVLLPYLPAPLLHEVVATTKLLRNIHLRLRVLNVLMPYMTEIQGLEILSETFTKVNGINDRTTDVHALMVLLDPHLALDLQEELVRARNIGTASDRAHALSALVPFLPQAQQSIVIEEALALTTKIGDADDIANIITVLAPHLKLNLHEEVLTMTLEIWDTSGCAKALGALAPHLRPDLLEQGLTIARLWNSVDQVYALCALIPYLSPARQVKVVEEALAIAKRNVSRVDVLNAVHPYLTPDLEEEWLIIAKGTWHPSDRVHVLNTIIPHLPKAKQAEVLKDALMAAREIVYKPTRIHAFSILVSHIPQLEQAAVLEEALTTATRLKNSSERASALSALVPHLSQPEQAAVLKEALLAAREIGDRDIYDDALRALVPHLPQPEQAVALEMVLTTAMRVEEPSERVGVLSTFVTYLTQPEQAAVLNEALVAIQKIMDTSKLANFLSILAPYLTLTLLEKALLIVRRIGNTSDQIGALSALMPHIPEAQLHVVVAEALAAARAIRDNSDRTSALVKLMPHIPEAQLHVVVAEALAAARAIRDNSDRTSALVKLMPHIPEAQLYVIAAEALETISMINYEDSQIRILKELVPQLPTLLLPEALAIARMVINKSKRITVLGALLAYLPKSQQNIVLAEALATASEIKNASDRVGALGVLLAYLPKSQQNIVLAEALATASEIKNASDRVSALSNLAPHLASWGSNIPSSAYPAYFAAIQRLSQHSRPEFVRDIRVLLPFILSLAGDKEPEVAVGIFRIIQDIYRWWP